MLSRREWITGAASAALLAERLAAMPLSAIKLGITTDEIDDNDQAAAEFLQRYNLKWAEIRNISGRYNVDQPMEKVRQVRTLLDQHAIRVSMEGTPFFKVELPPETPEGQKKLDAQWEVLERSKERAAALGTDKLRIFTFMLAKGQTATARDYARIDELLREAARRAKGFRLAVENIGGGFVGTGAQAGELLRRVKEDNVGITWDPNNAGQEGEKSFPDGFQKMDAARIFHVHLRDYKHEDGKVVWAAVGAGEFDNLGQIRALLKGGYSGTFTLETHWRDPKGKMYSTETSLKGLLAVIDKVAL